MNLANQNLTDKADKLFFNYYTGINSHSQKQEQFLDNLKSFGYNITTLPISKLPDGSHKVYGDDMTIAIDLLNNVKAGDSVVLVTGDGDFLPLVNELLHRHAFVTVVGSINKYTNKRLKQLNHRNYTFVSLNSLKNAIARTK